MCNDENISKDASEMLNELKSIKKPILCLNIDSVDGYELDNPLFTSEGIIYAGSENCLCGPFNISQIEYEATKRLVEVGCDDYNMYDSEILTLEEKVILDYKIKQFNLDFIDLKLLISLGCVPEQEYFLMDTLGLHNMDIVPYALCTSRTEIKEWAYKHALQMKELGGFFDKWDDMDEDQIIEWYKYLKANPEENWDKWENLFINF